MKYILIITFFLFSFNQSIAQTIFKTTSNDREAVQIVIYNQNFALVKEIRRLRIPIGEYDLKIEGIPNKIEPESIVIESISSPQYFKIFSLNYHYNLITPKNLLKKYIGKPIKVYFENPYTKQRELVEAILLNSKENIVCSINGEIYMPCPGQLILPKLPDEFFPNPTLLCHISNNEEQEQLIQLSYITQNMNWQTNYVLILTERKKGNLISWITINNESGATFHHAQVILIAGEIHKVQAPLLYRKTFKEEKIEEKPFFEYHLYTLPYPLELEDKQKKQVQFLRKEDILIEEKFIYRGSSYYYRSYYDVPITRDKIQVYLETVNDSKHNLGIPLPPGKVRVYQRNIEGNLIFIGEDKIESIPIKEKIKLNMGIAFDITATRRQIIYRRLTSNTYEIGWEITFNNNKETPVEITVLEEVPGDWKVVNASAPYQKISAHELQFLITVPPGSKEKLNYLVRVRD
ncbi:MAG: hypothetical protein LWW95_01870 [Candidatus Desulfofervidus auxilii]|nr:hypothetical protein [Candidatus Desulfofervidus auxilii]